MKRQRGVILISAMILVALATIIAATLFFETAMAARRSSAEYGMEQAVQFAAGAEALAAYGLSQDTNQTDVPTEDWAKPYGPVDIEEGIQLAAVLTDEQGKFNINTLINTNGAHDAEAMRIFQRLLELSGLDTRWGPLILDWIDTDSNPEPSGGEDTLYFARVPAHLTANQFVTSISELRQLPGFTDEMYQKLAPHITALPPSVNKVNVCSADGVVLDSLYAVSATSTGFVEHSQRTK